MTETRSTLLLVDDEANILSSLRRLFRPEGYRILTAEGGEEGLELLEAETRPVDLIISDMRMPGMNGAEFLAKAREQWPDTVRILLTGYADIGSTVSAINEGEIYRYVAKPWQDEDMLLLVRDVLARRKLERENAELLELTGRQNEELKVLNSGLETKVAERTRELSAALEKADAAHRELKQAYLTTVRVFSDLIESRSPILAGHGRRVADTARRIGRLLELTDAEQQDLMLASMLHDLGKLGLPDSLLDKPFTQLHGNERSQVMRHPARGEALLMAIPPLKAAAALIRHHHECFDGSGFPDALAGLAIPLGSRILAAANDYDALQLGTLVGRNLSKQEAMDYIAQNRGKRYDPQVTDALLQVAASDRGDAVSSDRQLTTGQLEAGMTLTRDLLHPDGYLLLARGFTLDDTLIEQLHRVERAEGKTLMLHIHNPQADK